MIYNLLRTTANLHINEIDVIIYPILQMWMIFNVFSELINILIFKIISAGNIVPSKCLLTKWHKSV